LQSFELVFLNETSVLGLGNGSDKMTSKLRETAKECMMYEERASTPPEIRKYRRSTNLEPGMRFKHHGVVDDYQSMNLDEKIYGITEDGRSRIGASDLINHRKPTELERINQIKAEKVYKQQNREPLGRMPDRGYVLPDKYTIGTIHNT
jgi:hypothetical protein